jgi:hypothetical protein
MSGCLLKSDVEVHGDHDSYRIRYLINEVTLARTSLDRLENDTRVSPDEVSGWERDLGVVIPKNWPAA